LFRFLHDQFAGSCSVIASEAKQSMARQRKYGLLRRLRSLAQTLRVCRRQ
jgi:hypothetical protein